MLGDPYITGPQLGAYMGIDLSVNDAERDTELQSAAASASRSITKACGRDFNQETSATARIFVPAAPRLLICDDFYTTDSLVIQVYQNGQPAGNPMSTPQYELLPLNGLVDGEVRPYTGFRLPWPFYRWLWAIDRVQITAKWGWASIPDDIIQATKILGAEYFKLRDAPLGIVQPGSGNNSTFMSHVRDVPQAWCLAEPYARQEQKVYLG